MGDWSKKTKATHKIIMEISLLIMEKSWNNHGIWILNFCGNPDLPQKYHCYSKVRNVMVSTF